MANPTAAEIKSVSIQPLMLKEPGLAAFLAWLLPGLGHFYQGRMAKGALFMVCILGTFYYGLFLGDGHVVYAAWGPQERRLPFLCQIGVGLPALPALVQAKRVRDGKEPLFGGWMAPPVRLPDGQHELDVWHRKYHRYFELGTVYTMIAGLLNVLVIYDALAGPATTEEGADLTEGPPGDESSGPPDTT